MQAAPAVVNIMVHSAGAFPTGSSGRYCSTSFAVPFCSSFLQYQENTPLRVPNAVPASGHQAWDRHGPAVSASFAAGGRPGLCSGRFCVALPQRVYRGGGRDGAD